MKTDPSLCSSIRSWELMPQKQAGISQQTAYDLRYLTTATSIKRLLPGPAFKDRCLKAVVAAWLHRNECEMCCCISVTSCLPAVTQRGVQVGFQGGFITKLFTLSPGPSSDTSACTFASLFLQGWLKIFSTLRTIFQ